ncbi:hypothetical protein ACWEIJ_14310 [Lentzea sp. NPDC004789]
MTSGALSPPASREVRTCGGRGHSPVRHKAQQASGDGTESTCTAETEALSPEPEPEPVTS